MGCVMACFRAKDDGDNGGGEQRRNHPLARFVPFKNKGCSPWVYQQAPVLKLDGVWKHSKSEDHEDYGLLVCEKARKYAIVKELDTPSILKDGTIVSSLKHVYRKGWSVVEHISSI